MTEINKDMHIQSARIKPAMPSKKDFIEEPCTCDECMQEMDLSNDPANLYGRAGIKKVELDAIEDAKACEAYVEECTKYFMENPEVCDFAMGVCDKFLEKGCSVEEAFAKTAVVMSNLNVGLRS